nr:MAG TPA: hypothetical protein [Caudoviricetes sp.]
MRPRRKNEKINISIFIRCRMALLKYHSIRHMSSPPKIKKPPSGGIFNLHPLPDGTIKIPQHQAYVKPPKNKKAPIRGHIL